MGTIFGTITMEGHSATTSYFYNLSSRNDSFLDENPMRFLESVLGQIACCDDSWNQAHQTY
jgi:hypothetical protein